MRRPTGAGKHTQGFFPVEDPTGTGVFLRFTARNSGSFIETPLGKIAGLNRFTSVHRYEPFWMKPTVGKSHAAVQFETQWLLAETKAGECVMLVPLINGAFRFSLSGGDAGLVLTGETGDPFTFGAGGVALFVSAGRDPYAMADAGAKAVMKRLGTGKLRVEKPAPILSTCSDGARGIHSIKKFRPTKCRTGLESFKAGGVEPRLLILDDGWQDYKRMPSGEEPLVSLGANQERFGGDLTPTVKLAKQDFKIRTFLVWQTMYGYWGGVDGKSLPGYDVRNVPQAIRAGDYASETGTRREILGAAGGPGFGRKDRQVHERLSPADEGPGRRRRKGRQPGGNRRPGNRPGRRVVLTRAYREALEKSVAANFDGRLINCMSNGMETYYGSPLTTLIRTSIDFWPLRPETHGLHIYTNALVGLWFGEFMQPDWDMFQSGHQMGSFHAAGRAISGGPVYVSDKPDAHDFKLLNKLVLSDGSVLRAGGVGRPTRDCLFADVLREPVLLKVFNYNRDCAVIGVFNANYHRAAAERATIEGSVSPSDAPELKGEEFVGFAHRADRLWRCKRAGREPLKLAEGEWEIVSFAPVDRGVAVLGLADKLNSTAAATEKGWADESTYKATLRDGGEFVAWTDKPLIRSVESNGKAVEFKYDGASGRLSAATSRHRPAITDNSLADRGTDAMIRVSILIILIVVLSGANAFAAEPVEVFAGIPPVAYLVERIGGDRVHVEVFIQPGQDPHTFEPGPRQIQALGQAGLFFKVGLPFENQVLEKIRTTHPRLTVVDTTEGIEKRPISAKLLLAAFVGGAGMRKAIRPRISTRTCGYRRRF